MLRKISFSNTQGITLKTSYCLCFLFILLLSLSCASTEKNAKDQTPPKKETPEFVSKPSPAGREEDTKPRANTQPTSNPVTTHTEEVDTGKISKSCEPYDEEGEKSKCKGSMESLRGETFLEFDLKKSKKAHIAIEITVKEGELKVDIPSFKNGLAKKGKSFIYLGEVATSPDPLKISLNSEDRKVSGIEYNITIYH